EPRVSSDLSTPTALSAAQGTDTAAAPAPAPELTGFPPLAADRPARVVVVGAGAMGSWWAREIAASPGAELAGVADLVEGAPQRVIEQSSVPYPAAVGVGTDGVDLALEVEADLIVNPTVPLAHHPVTIKALQAGVPVLGEKPVTETLPEALSLVAHAELTGTPFMVSQSRRFFRQ